MIRTISLTALALPFLPVAIILLLFGIERVNPSRRKDIWLKLAVIINSALVIVLGITGCTGKPGGRVSCYDVEMSDFTEIPAGFEKSNDWSELESVLMNLEYDIESGVYNDKLASSYREQMNDSIANLTKSDSIDEDDASVLYTYCNGRSDYYTHAIGGATCYSPMPIPEGKEAAKEDAVEAVNELRRLYADGKINTPAYETTLENLDANLKLYTDKEDNVVLRQLLLDLADGRSGTYF